MALVRVPKSVASAWVLLDSALSPLGFNAVQGASTKREYSGLVALS